MGFCIIIFVPIKYVCMEYPMKAPRSTPRCLECGDKISYGRSDKKFCCEDCKNRHHNHKVRSSRSVKRRVVSALERNYDILEGVVKSGENAVSLSEVMALGFNPAYATSFRKVGHRQVYECFDIIYIMTASRLCAISKIFH